MASEEVSIAPQGTKSKQERIRDNQRRSRARRQEYLIGLEKRVKECQVSCREADLQRAAYADLQIENARLRDLLYYVGIGPDLVENFGRRGIQALPANPAVPAPRQIKPRYHQPSVERTGDLYHVGLAKQESIPESARATFSAPASLCAPIPVLPPEPLQAYSGQECLPLVATCGAPATSLSEVTSMSSLSSYEWMHGSDSQEPPAYSPETFCCDTFGIPQNGPLLPDSANTVQCLIAKAMIDRYEPTLVEMEEITARLATAFSLPRSGEAGCRVNAQILLEILQEMDTRPKRD